MKRSLSFLLVFMLLLSGCAHTASDKKEEITGTPTPVTDPGNDPIITDIPDETDAETEPVPVPGTWQGEDRDISFLACGDNIIYYGNIRDAQEKSAGGELSFAYSYAPIASMIEEADIAFINQETLMAGEGYAWSYYPRFNSPQEVGKTLANVGFDIINIANNHMLDKGGAGLRSTIAFWRSQPVLLIGDYLSRDELSEVDIYEYEGLKIAFVSFTYGTNGLQLAAGREEVIPYLDREFVTARMEQAKAAADLVIASCHWGDENVFTPNAQQREYAQLLCDLGADVIIGHHPHVIQTVEWLQSEDGGQRTLCIYSLGNLMAEMAGQYNMLGGIARFEIVLRRGERPRIESPEFIPTVFWFSSSFRNNTVYLMQDFTAELASKHGISYYGNRLSLPSLYAKVRELIPPEFLPDGFDANRF